MVPATQLRRVEKIEAYLKVVNEKLNEARQQLEGLKIMEEYVEDHTRLDFHGLSAAKVKKFQARGDPKKVNESDFSKVKCQVWSSPGGVGPNWGLPDVRQLFCK